MNINSKNYFNKKLKWKKNYNLIVVKSKKDLNDMISYFIYFLKLKSNFKCIGMDFEFNSSTEGKKIALFQINLETEKNVLPSARPVWLRSAVRRRARPGSAGSLRSAPGG